MIRAALFDFGGVILTSPFDAFAAYERDNGLPAGFIRQLNATNHHDNAWAKLERNEVGVDGFCDLFEAEAAAAGHRLDARAVVALLAGEVRPEMVEAVRRCGQRLTTACLTNNFVADERGDAAVPEDADGGRAAAVAEVMALFDVVVESSKVGVRKPDPRFYRIALREVGVAANEAVFLDDLGVNLKPAREMGMTTIKVDDPDTALAELESVLGFPLRG